MEMRVFSFEVEEGNFLRVIEWGDRADFDRAVGHDAYAYFHFPRIRAMIQIKELPRIKVTNRTVGIIHLVSGEYGVGVFSHELQHFIQSWLYVKGIDGYEEGWEEVPKLVEWIQREYWTWWTDERETTPRKIIRRSEWNG